jgi:phosphotransferase system IIA component
MMHKLLDTVALTGDHFEAGLRKGDVGAVVEVLGDDAYEVEFVAASGRTQALIALARSEVRALGDKDLLSVRSFAETAA